MKTNLFCLFILICKNHVIAENLAISGCDCCIIYNANSENSINFTNTMIFRMNTNASLIELDRKRAVKQLGSAYRKKTINEIKNLNDNYSVDTEDISNGIYFFNIDHQNNKSLTTKKFMTDK